ncbi:MAG: LOG family protein YvdD [Chlamydiae bacterium]|nr:LOG family protein YvdD [Chlamydiota bacterium]
MSKSRDDLPPHKHTHTLDSWRVFRILSELVDGFETMVSLGPGVAFFGSARTQPNNPYYQQATECAKKVVEKGFAVMTGGGPGIMEAANKGAQEKKGKSCGICIDVPHEIRANDFVDPKLTLHFRYFFIRKIMFVRYAQAFVVFPGGFGSLDELFEALTLVQTKKIKPIPIFLVGKTYWQGLLDWMKDSLLKEKNIGAKDLDLIHLTDDVDHIAEQIDQYYKKTRSFENF